MMKYCTDGSVYSDVFEAIDLYVLQIAPSASPTPLVLLKKQIEAFGAKNAEHPDETQMPKDMGNLSLSYHAIYNWVWKN